MNPRFRWTLLVGGVLAAGLAAAAEAPSRYTFSWPVGPDAPAPRGGSTRGAPVVLTGIGLPDDGLHSPNEKLDLKQLWDGIATFRKFFELMGAAKRGG